MRSIFTVTMVTKDFRGACFGWFEKFEEAEKIVLESGESLFEYYYSHAVIEEFGPGFTCSSREEWYFYDHDAGKCIRVVKPEAISKIVNWGMG
jgi:hypothetical protein